jgi:hypothetical protein
MRKPFAFCILLGISGAALAQNHTPTPRTMLGAFELQTSEAFINNLYIAPNGFDDNDPIEFMIEGILPNACYAINETPKLAATYDSFTVRQPTYRKTEGPCAAPDGALKGITANPYPFKDVVKMGSLQKGKDYKLFYLTTAGFRNRSFNVKAAPTDSTDSLNYAYVENAYIPVRSFEGAPVRIVVQSALTSSCQRPIKEFRLDPDDNPNDDIVVILPEVEVAKDDLCFAIYEPFERVVEVPGLKAGRYQLQVRSFNGGSVNRIFNVY